MTENTTPTTATPKASTPKKATPKSKVEKKKESGLRKPQQRILKALKGGKAMSRATISEKASVDAASMVEYIGSHDPEVRKANDKKHFTSMITLGLVRAEVNEDGPVTYTITAKGTSELAKI